MGRREIGIGCMKHVEYGTVYGGRRFQLVEGLPNASPMFLASSNRRMNRSVYQPASLKKAGCLGGSWQLAGKSQAISSPQLLEA